MVEKKLRVLTLKMVEINRLSDIDIIGQRFKAEVLLQFAFVGRRAERRGRRDKDHTSTR